MVIYSDDLRCIFFGASDMQKMIARIVTMPLQRTLTVRDIHIYAEGPMIQFYYDYCMSCIGLKILPLETLKLYLNIFENFGF